ncbi:MAG: GNAT family N-acetyltransferase [Clostridiales Family XIII bacterium]|jgi:GNAT superfamily N-acetyltransferase|nr:GNAT family N-acetyltransferase [Clostridiales Family XIII bacterium]
MEIREAAQGDLMPLLDLYRHLHDNPMPAAGEALDALWRRILADENHRILLGLADGGIVSSCVLLIVPNLTRGQRPYALVENVVTRADRRGRGYATRLLAFAGELAERENCYKIMLMTGSKDASVLGFYERAGYNRQDKTAFIRWL